MYRHLLGFVLIAAHVVVLQHCCGVVQMCILLVTDVCVSHNPEQDIYLYNLKCLVVFSLCTVVSVFTSVVSSPFNYEHLLFFIVVV